MSEITEKDINQDINDLYDYYIHSKIDRREFVDRLSLYVVGGLTVPDLLNYLMPNYEDRQQVRADDLRVDSEYINYDSPEGGGSMKALLAQPAANTEKLTGILVVHENRGLNPHIKDITRRAGLGDFIALGPDALTPLGGYPRTDDKGRLMQRKRDRYEILEDFIAGARFIMNHPDCSGHIGVVGFYFGGWISNMMAVKMPELKPAVPYYGGQPDDADVPRIQAPLLLQNAELDKRVNAG